MKTYQIQIALKNIKPKIWRRILISSDMLLSDFHKVIQTSMGWENEHLHQFIHNRKYYAQKMPDDDTWDDYNNIDYKKLKVYDLLKHEKEKLIYEYDFGDGWTHDIILEKILPVDNSIKLPVCIGGKMTCPPEDCGGAWGYTNMLEVLNQPKNEEYESYIEWLGGEFDPDDFDKDEISEFLQEDDFGCFEF